MISKVSPSLRGLPSPLLPPTGFDAMEPVRRTPLPKHRSGTDRESVAVQLGALLETLATRREPEARELYRRLVMHPALRGILSRSEDEVDPPAL